MFLVGFGTKTYVLTLVVNYPITLFAGWSSFKGASFNRVVLGHSFIVEALKFVEHYAELLILKPLNRTFNKIHVTESFKATTSTSARDKRPNHPLPFANGLV